MSVLKWNLLNTLISKFTLAPFRNKVIADSTMKKDAEYVMNSTGPGELNDALNFKSSFLMSLYISFVFAHLELL